ncbi:MAG TPA: hypothetical protein VEY09_09365 [Pyrinomonadaceae bacterium]|nr:hypothetical protein [Pyrinomonadaceae bacterium]
MNTAVRQSFVRQSFFTCAVAIRAVVNRVFAAQTFAARAFLVRAFGARLALALALSTVFLTAAQARAAGQGAEAPLTNTSVIKLVRAGFREKTVVAIIRARPVAFDLSPERLIELKKAGVSERVILAMLARQGAADFASGDWDSDDEAFFADPRGDNRTAGGDNRTAGGAGAPGGVDIFGSSGGSRGQTRSRGMSGGASGDTQTAGSATVRILRPPAEQGGPAAAKLERTPTLDNNSVIELVEAGFSEGTIVRRIELSPVEFDLSPQKLAELRRRRVTEPVIAAMRAAMGEEAEATRP